jgi:hypothetical protein
MTAHIVQYRTTVGEPEWSDHTFRHHTCVGLEGCCEAFEEAFTDGFITHGRTEFDDSVHLRRRKAAAEDRISDREVHVEIDHCPFCGATVAEEQVAVDDERDG